MAFRIVARYREEGKKFSKENKEEALVKALEEAKRICREFEENGNYPLSIQIEHDVKQGAWIATVEMEFKHYECFMRRKNEEKR